MRTREQVVKRRIAVRRLRTIDAKGYQQTRHRCRTPAELSSDATRQATHRRPVSSIMVGCTQVIDRHSLAKQWIPTRRAQLVSSLFPYALQSTMLAFSIVQAPMHSTLQGSALAIAQVFLKSFQARQESSTFALDAIDLGASKAPDSIASSINRSSSAERRGALLDDFARVLRLSQTTCQPPQTQAVAASSFGASSSFRRKIMSRQVSVKDQGPEPPSQSAFRASLTGPQVLCIP
ncbi:hypothetical protein FB107DRAFT_280284 [Schizophyllum commune]